MKYKLNQVEGHIKLIQSAKDAYNVFAKYHLRETQYTGGYLVVGIDDTRKINKVLLHGIGHIDILGPLKEVEMKVLNEFYRFAKKKSKKEKKPILVISKKNYGFIGIPSNEYDLDLTHILGLGGNLGHGNDCIAAWAAIDNGHMTHDQAIELYQENQYINSFLERMKEFKNVSSKRDTPITFTKTEIIKALRSNSYLINATSDYLGLSIEAFLHHVAYYKIGGILVED